MHIAGIQYIFVKRYTMRKKFNRAFFVYFYIGISIILSKAVPSM